MTITEFLLARIAEDEAQARDPEHHPLRYGVDRVTTQTLADRVLAECQAKRRIISLHEINPYYGTDRYGRWLPHEGEPRAWYCDCQCEDGVIVASAPCLTLRFLASVYADHPDYDPAWRA